MKIAEVENKHIKICKTSITIKNDSGKTAGVIRGICKYKDLQPNKQHDFFSIVRGAGLWGCSLSGVMDAVVCVDNKLYYLHNLKPIEAYTKYFRDNEMFSSEKKNYEKRLEIAEAAGKLINVIPCYID